MINKTLSYVLIFAFFYSCSFEEPPSDNMAYIISQDFVTMRLSDPSSASFINSTRVVAEIEVNTYSVKAQFDAKNAFGGNIRYTYFAKLSYKGGDAADINNWSLIDLQIK